LAVAAVAEALKAVEEAIGEVVEDGAMMGSSSVISWAVLVLVLLMVSWEVPTTTHITHTTAKLPRLKLPQRHKFKDKVKL
jgi:hypothetical protein